ncbi:MAG: NUDIX hydrolase [Bacteroides sp.]
MKEINDTESKRWKVLSSEYLHREPWLTVRRERTELPNGNQVPAFYVLEYPNWVNTIAITKAGEFVLIRQYRHGLGRVDWELCAGVCEKEDASPLISAQRELLEETGYGNGDWTEYMQISANPSTQSNMTYCFLAINVEKVSEQHLEATEDISVHLLSKTEVKELLQKDEMKQALMAAPLWKYMANNQ